MTVILRFYTELKQTILNSWYVKTTGHPLGGYGRLSSPIEIGTMNQNFLEFLTSAAQFRLIDLLLAITVPLPVWHSHCTRARFTVLVSCSGELAVHSCPLLCLQGQVAKIASGWFYCWSLLCNNNMATKLLMFTSRDDSRRLALVTIERRHLGR